MAERSSVCNFGWKAPEFNLPSTEGRQLSLSSIAGENGTLVMFICNHCPYVHAVIDRLNAEVFRIGGIRNRRGCDLFERCSQLSR